MSLVDDESQIRNIVKHLQSHKNVLLSGPPGTGKSRMLSAVKETFKAPIAGTTPVMYPTEDIAIPAQGPQVTPEFLTGITAVETFDMAFDQNTKHSDFLRGIVPQIASGIGFRVSKGVLYQAAEFARVPGQAALVVIDEINRGPAVSIFGSAMVALEPAKRQTDEGDEGPETQPFQLLDDDGQLKPFLLPSRLYILAAMNQADTSVEPMDVAFLRRFARVNLKPDPETVLSHFGLAAEPAFPADTPLTPSDVYGALYAAWKGINRRIARGKGEAYQMGHGLLMRAPAATDLAPAISDAADIWDLMFAHVDEVFYGDNRGLAEALGSANPNPAYVIEEDLFGDQQVAVIALKDPATTIYQRLVAAR